MERYQSILQEFIMFSQQWLICYGLDGLGRTERQIFGHYYEIQNSPIFDKLS